MVWLNLPDWLNVALKRYWICSAAFLMMFS